MLLDGVNLARYNEAIPGSGLVIVVPQKAILDYSKPPVRYTLFDASAAIPTAKS